MKHWLVEAVTSDKTPRWFLFLAFLGTNFFAYQLDSYRDQQASLAEKRISVLNELELSVAEFQTLYSNFTYAVMEQNKPDESILSKLMKNLVRQQIAIRSVEEYIITDGVRETNSYSAALEAVRKDLYEPKDFYGLKHSFETTAALVKEQNGLLATVRAQVYAIAK